MTTDPLLAAFPGLAASGYRITSPPTLDYNCIAWAASRIDRWWWPSPDAFWPEEVPTVTTLEAFEAAFTLLGYQRCASGELDPELEKVVIVADAQGQPTHAARQLANGRWTSKLGPNVDIEHGTPDALNGEDYGSAVLFMSRLRS
jgi:hypothetical protein